jgi:hypothetical protein
MMLRLENDVELSVHVDDPVPRMRHSVTGPIVWPGSVIWNDAMSPEPACVMVSGTPPIVTVPVRAPPVFAGTVMVTVPAPLPEAPLAIVRNESVVVAVHAHAELLLETVAVTVPPVAATLLVVLDTPTAQFAGAFGGSCVKLMVVEPIVIDALRTGP